MRQELIAVSFLDEEEAYMLIIPVGCATAVCPAVNKEECLWSRCESLLDLGIILQS